MHEGAELYLPILRWPCVWVKLMNWPEACNSIIIPADATNTDDLENLVEKSMEFFGGKFDFVLHSIGMSPNVRKGIPYDNINYDYLSENTGYFSPFIS